jgi:hypothetical protein
MHLISQPRMATAAPTPVASDRRPVPAPTAIATAPVAKPKKASCTASSVCVDQAELLAVAGRQLVHRAIKICLEALGQRIPNVPIDPTPELREIVEHRPSCQLRVQGEVTR